MVGGNLIGKLTGESSPCVAIVLSVGSVPSEVSIGSAGMMLVGHCEVVNLSWGCRLNFQPLRYLSDYEV